MKYLLSWSLCERGSLYRISGSVVVFLTVVSTVGTFAQGTNLVGAIQKHIVPAPAVWGEPRVGTSVRVEPDTRASEFLQNIRPIFQANDRTAPGGLLRAAARIQAPPATLVGGVNAPVGSNPQLFARPGNGTVMQLRGSAPLERKAGARPIAAAGESERTARSFLRKNSALLRIDDPDNELRLDAKERDSIGYQHLRFSQIHQGIPLWPAGLNVHLDANGDLDSLEGAYIPTPAGVVTKPVLSADQAVARFAAIEPGGTASEIATVIHSPLSGPARLAWKFRYSVDFQHAWLVLVDASNGQILSRVNQVFDVSVPTSGKDLDGVNRNLNAWSANGKLYMIDTTKRSFNNAFDPVADPHGAISIFDARNVTENNLNTVYIVESITGNDWIPDAISALFNFGHTYDYYLERHERNSLDGNGGNVQAVVRVLQMDNAFWNGNLKMMFFGTFRPFAAALDVVGHELTHGVTQNSADLIYELQSGALNESFSDIFGELVEARIRGKADWLLGVNVGKVYRDLKTPGSLLVGGLNRPYPSRMSEYIDLPNSNDSDHGGVHINSSIVNHAFYLLAEGLDGGIGLIDAGKIFYRCLTQHLQRQSQFIDARLGCIASAEELFGVGSTQARKTAAAFDAVEIFGAPPTPEPTPIPPVQGADSTLIVAFDPFFGGSALGRREAAFQDPADGIALVDSVKVARPSISGDGSLATFVDGAADVCLVRTDSGNSVNCVGMPGTVHSVAMSPDAALIAVVLRDPNTGLPDNRISVLNVTQNTVKTFELLAPTVDGNPADNVLYADSMVFTPDGKQLIYDAVSEIRFGGGAAVQRSSIFRLNLPTEATTVLVPPIDGVDTGNPNIAHTTSRYLTFDARDLASGMAGVINLDLFTGEVGLVGRVGRGLGYPCFNGDDTAVIYAVEDETSPQTGRSLVAQQINADRLSTNGAPSLWLADANIGVIYRRGSFTNANALPTVTLTSPQNNSTTSAPGRITLAADASDPDGSVAKVEFYEGGNKLGEVAAPPYRFVWTAVPAGNYRIFARAIDNLGAIGDSAAISLTVVETTPTHPQLAVTHPSGGVIRLVLTGPAADYIIEQSNDLKSWADIYPVTIGASGSASIDDSGGPANNRVLFYRARKN